MNIKSRGPSMFDYRLCQNLKTFFLNEKACSRVSVDGPNTELCKAYVKEINNRYVTCCFAEADSSSERSDWYVDIGHYRVESEMKSFRYHEGRVGTVVLCSGAQDTQPCLETMSTNRFVYDELISKEITERSEFKLPVMVFRRIESPSEEAIEAVSSDKLCCDDIEDPESIQQIIYDMCITSVGVPCDEAKRVFRVPEGNRLGICLIEFRRLKWLRHIVNQIANVYGGTDVSLYVIHGRQNRELFRDIVKEYRNVELVEYPYDNIDRDRYADICCEASFYKLFRTEFVLKMEWDSYIRKRVPEVFFEYAYVGAPWQGYPNDYLGKNIFKRLGNKLVGNGGFSLRNVSRMIEVCEQNPNRPHNIGEDVFITNHLRDDEVPDAKCASEFGVEFIYNPDPVGLHHVWTIHDIDKVKAWFSV